MFQNIILILSIFVLAGCSLKKADVDLDPKFQIESLKTFTVVYKNEDGYYSLNEERIVTAIKDEINKKEYKESLKERADFYMTFYIDAKEKIHSDINFGFGIGKSSRRSVLSLGTSRDLVYDEMNLIINAVDSKTKKVFWNSYIEIDSLEHKSPKEREEYLNKIVSVMLEEFPKSLN